MNELYASHDWVDVMRRFVPETEKLYSWWSYRAKDWEAADRGRRLDHIWSHAALSEAPGFDEGSARMRGVGAGVGPWPVIATLRLSWGPAFGGEAPRRRAAPWGSYRLVRLPEMGVPGGGVSLG